MSKSIIVPAPPGFVAVHTRPDFTVGSPVVAFEVIYEGGERFADAITIDGLVDLDTDGLLYPDGRVSLPEGRIFPDLESAKAFHGKRKGKGNE